MSSEKPDPYKLDQKAGGARPGAAEEKKHEGFEASTVNGVQIIAFDKASVLDAYEIEKLGDDIYQYLKPLDNPRVVIDLKTVEHLSSSALSMLILLKKVVDKKDGKICIANVGDTIMAVFKLTRLNKQIKIHDSTEKAVGAMG